MLTLIIILLILYILYIGSNLNLFIQKLFNNTIFRIIILFLLIYIYNENISSKLFILIIIAYILSLDNIYVIKSKKMKSNYNELFK